ncbi:MAG: trypsin-like peptidase domain-containing protein [Spirochaetales bacterium]|nr:trypsin-like peptidase domain-containing protein [Spirochaetales bacterium]
MKLYSAKETFLYVLLSFLSASVIFSSVYIVNLKKVIDSQEEGAVKILQRLEDADIDSFIDEKISLLNSSDHKFSDNEKTNIEVYEKYNKAVVNITTEVLSWSWFMDPVPQAGGSGSGSIIDEDGYVLTNTHVVDKAYKVFVRLYDGSEYEGEVIGTDKENDLAVVKFNPGEKKLTTIKFGDSTKLRVGEKVLAIGNPFGYDRTLTTGVVSGLGRPVRSGKNLIIRNMIQTDASINPGNSGGPLLDSLGRLIGINTMIYTPSGGSVGIGFAVPVDTAKRVIPDLIEFGMVRRGWIDISPVQLNESIARYAGLDIKSGILVSAVAEGSIAEKSGLRGGNKSKPVRYGRSVIYLGGDIIVGIDNIQVTSFSDFFAALEDKKQGDFVTLSVIRDGKEVKIQVELIERPENLVWE